MGKWRFCLTLSVVLLSFSYVFAQTCTTESECPNAGVPYCECNGVQMSYCLDTHATPAANPTWRNVNYRCEGGNCIAGVSYSTSDGDSNGITDYICDNGTSVWNNANENGVWIGGGDSCIDSKDNDYDGTIDCSDSDCSSTTSCDNPPVVTVTYTPSTQYAGNSINMTIVITDDKGIASARFFGNWAFQSGVSLDAYGPCSGTYCTYTIPLSTGAGTNYNLTFEATDTAGKKGSYSIYPVFVSCTSNTNCGSEVLGATSCSLNRVVRPRDLHECTSGSCSHQTWGAWEVEDCALSGKTCTIASNGTAYCATSTLTPLCANGAIPGNGACYCGGIYYNTGYCCNNVYSSSTPCSTTAPQCTEGAVPNSGCICSNYAYTSGYCCYSYLTNSLVWAGTNPCTQTCASINGQCCSGSASDCVGTWSSQWATDCQGYVCCIGTCTGTCYGTNCPAKKPDLVIEDIWYDAPSYIKVKYCNRGTNTSTSTFLIRLQSGTSTYDGNSYYPFSVPAVGSCSTTGGYTIGLIGLAQGDTKSVTATIDWENKVSESNENNNAYTETLSLLNSCTVSSSIPSTGCLCNGTAYYSGYCCSNNVYASLSANCPKACSEQNGDICSSEETCSGTYLTATDSNKCCSVTCTSTYVCSTTNYWYCYNKTTCEGLGTGYYWCTGSCGSSGWCANYDCRCGTGSQVSYCYTETECTSKSGYWCLYDYSSSCGTGWCQSNACATCDSNNLWKCKDQTTCTSAGGSWCTNVCPTCTPYCTTYGSCPKCDSSNVWNCYTQTGCTNVGGYWCSDQWSPGWCQSNACATCDSNNLWKCKDQTTCTSAGGSWCANICSTCTSYCSSSCPKCSSSELWSCYAQTECKNAGGYWCGGEKAWCQSNACASCTSTDYWNCYTKSECEAAGRKWCTSVCSTCSPYCTLAENCKDCSSSNIWNCYTDPGCTSAGGYWCSDKWNYTWCQTNTCSKCSKNDLMRCNTKEECTNPDIGGYWCSNEYGYSWCQVSPCGEAKLYEICADGMDNDKDTKIDCNDEDCVCPSGMSCKKGSDSSYFCGSVCSSTNIWDCKTESDCKTSGGNWCGTWCDKYECPICSKEKPWNCNAEKDCITAGAKWCGSFCQNTDCPTCGSTQLWNCNTKDTCKSAGGYWCSDAWGGWCQSWTCGAVQEACGNRIDDNSDGLVDCFDKQCACWGDTSCKINQYGDYICVGTCSSLQPWSCQTKSECTNAGANWCESKKETAYSITSAAVSTASFSSGWCQESRYECPTCKKSEPWNCYSEEECKNVGANWCIGGKGEKWCNKEGCPVCGSTQLWNCYTKSECVNNGGNWCGTYCTNAECPTCSKEQYWNCYSKQECINAGAKWCENIYGGWCNNYECPECSKDKPWNCYSEKDCTNGGNYWCDNYCQDKPCLECTKKQPWSCRTKLSCKGAGGNWCGDEKNGWCQEKECTSCSKDSIEFCLTLSECKSAGGYWCGGWCNSYACPTCSKEMAWDCHTKGECENANANWCSDEFGSWCDKYSCSVCSEEQVWFCASKADCEKVNGKWCSNMKGGWCSSFDCPTCLKEQAWNCYTEKDCTTAGANWCTDKWGSWCSSYECPVCSVNQPWNCFSESECLNSKGNWCGTYCSNEKCPKCSYEQYWNCYSRETCEKTGRNWCENRMLTISYDISGALVSTIEQMSGWCQDIKCTGGKNICDSNENCLSSSDCVCPEGFVCNPKDKYADFMGCVFDYAYTEGDGYCDNFFGENCKSLDCVCPAGAECNPANKDADFKGCVYKFEFTLGICPSGLVCNDGVCNKGETCKNSKDCSPCPPDSYCEPENKKADSKGCTIHENIMDYRCGFGENCASNPFECICPPGFKCNTADRKADPIGCVAPEGLTNESFIWGTCLTHLRHSCENSPFCSCPPGIECNPKDERADDRGCVPLFKCHSDVKTCCGDKKCDLGECNTCPYDCSPKICAADKVCNPSSGENCVTAPEDCSCKEKICNITSAYANVKGCVPLADANGVVPFCGDGIKAESETSENCCLDAGCAIGKCVPSYNSFKDSAEYLYYILPGDFVCLETYCGDGICDSTESSDTCCLDCACSEGACVGYNLGKFACVNTAECGNGAVEQYETSYNCCLDAGCPAGMECEEGVCLEKVNLTMSLECSIDSDCVCYSGCGAIPKTLANLNPECPEDISDCTLGKAVPVCISGKCSSKFISEEENTMLSYKARLDELNIRLSAFITGLKENYNLINDLTKFYIEPKVLEKLDEISDSYDILIRRAEKLSEYINSDEASKSSEAVVNFAVNELERLIEESINLSELHFEAIGFIPGGTVVSAAGG